MKKMPCGPIEQLMNMSKTIMFFENNSLSSHIHLVSTILIVWVFQFLVIKTHGKYLYIYEPS